VRAATLRRVLAHHGFPDEILLDGAAEYRIAQVDGADLLILRIDYI